MTQIDIFLFFSKKCIKMFCLTKKCLILADDLKGIFLIA